MRSHRDGLETETVRHAICYYIYAHTIAADVKTEKLMPPLLLYPFGICLDGCNPLIISGDNNLDIIRM